MSTDGMKGVTFGPRTNLSGERVSIKAKLDLEFLEMSPSTPRPSTTSKSKRARKVSRLRIPSVLTTIRPPSSSAHANVRTTPVGRSGPSNRLPSSSPLPSSPSPFQAFSQMLSTSRTASRRLTGIHRNLFIRSDNLILSSVSLPFR